MLSVHATGQTHPPGRSTARNGLQHHHAVPGGIPGPRAILPAGLQRPSPVATPLGHGTFADQDVGEQVPNVSEPDPAEVPENGGYPPRHPEGAGSGCRTRCEEKTTGSPFRRHRIALAEERHSRRRTQGGVQRSERGGATPSGEAMRAMWSERELSGSPRPQAGRSEPTRPEREAALGQADGRTPPQDAGSLPSMPRGHSSRTAE